MALGRALESASVSILLNKIATQQVLDFFLKWKLDTALLSKMKSLLLMIYAVLNHAEERHVEDAAVKLWLDSVKDAAYDAEDLLDEIATDALRSQNSTNQVRNAIYDTLNAPDSVKEGIDFKLKDISSSLNPFEETLESKLRKLIERLEDIAKQKDILRLREDVVGKVSSVFERLPTTPLVVESSVHEEFHCLKHLTIVGCPRLKELPTSLPSLVILEIDGCDELPQLPKLEKLQELDLLDSNLGLLGSLSDLSSLSALRVNNISYMLCLPKRFVQHFPNLMELKVVACGDLVTLANEQTGLNHLTHLQNLTISQCPNLVALPDEGNNLPPALQFLDLRHCHNLVKLPSELYKVSSLEELRIEGCAKLELLPQMGLPSMLKRLVIHQCEALKTLSDGLLHNNSDLEYLEIRGCSSLITILEEGELPATLKHLNIHYCKNLKTLPEGLMRQNNMTLEYLELVKCTTLEYFPTGKLPTTLKQLAIHNCTILKSLPETFLNLMRLERLEISDCDLLEYFPRGGLPTISLRAISISGCMNLKSLPERIHNLKSLQELLLQNCPSLNSIPRQGLPSNLKVLSIKDCENLNAIHEWKLHKLASLEIFSFGGYPGLVSFSNEYLLPHTITSLTIERLPNLVSISEALQNLEVLDTLEIHNCPKLSSLPKEGLPATVCKLKIVQCPLLRAQCERDRGQYWPKISCIPFLLLD
ncbi:Rx, N-terminal [Dillenia turbinata]|uniref:Rx, N-terminal n=1 Tax=Dillenia turbinata TaxID=194707 RepID=A0AAN8VTZ8_9MAGN